ncbi:MAG: hypothetical protein SF182_27020 [Deltaproteobacteria bacterium]|nr:hypothetical protein [Deltaproteobacteria bacterium]
MRERTPPRLCLVTAIADDEPIKWGLDLGRVAVPLVVLCGDEIAPRLRAEPRSASVLLHPAALPAEWTPAYRLEALRGIAAARLHAADVYYWVDARLLYQHLSFEFVYSNLLAGAVAHHGTAPGFFAMPGYEPASFFGGGAPDLLAVPLPAAAEDVRHLFEDAGSVASPPAAIRAVFGLEGRHDLNLNLADRIEQGVLHVIGDSHVYNCFTPNASIGCRPNVLLRSADVNPVPIPYAYQFTHHLGGRTLHHAGQPGALTAIAAEARVKDGDAVVWVFGEIDARCHIIKREREAGEPVDAVIETLVRNFVRGMLEVRHHYPRLRQVAFAPIPPLDNPDYESATLPVVGSIAERVAATRLLRAVLAERCARHAIDVLDASAPFETERGDLRWDMSDHFCHIGSAYQGLVLDRLYALLADAGAVSRPPAG